MEGHRGLHLWKQYFITAILLTISHTIDGHPTSEGGSITNDILKYLDPIDTRNTNKDIRKKGHESETGDRPRADSMFTSSGAINSNGPVAEGNSFAFASYYGDHMVLQKAPQAAGVWGYADPMTVGQPVGVKVTNGKGVVQSLQTQVKQGFSATRGVWSVQLGPVQAGGPYSITVKLGNTSISISDVLFGDVWLCSGQSNMEFTVSQLSAADLKLELETVGFHPEVRLFTAEQKTSTHEEFDLLAIRQPWSVASPKSINGGPWKYFSALCWVYGRRLSQTLGYPVGLVATDWGGTRDEAWSSADALKVCGAHLTGEQFRATVKDPLLAGGPNDKSVLWNAMIHPFLNMTIYGAIWYQGESNSFSVNYNCTFPAMIQDWRYKFHVGSAGQTDIHFPFGFVQLAPNAKGDILGGFPLVRWQQTANVGYVPNAFLPKVFMAVAMDLPDFSSPYESVHPRDKETIADRLLLSGLSVAYGQGGRKYQGPYPTSVHIGKDTTTGEGFITIQYDMGQSSLLVRSLSGFEICCQKDKSIPCQDKAMGPGSGWLSVPIVKHDRISVTLSTCAVDSDWILGIRYAWRESPCPYKLCAVYSVENLLPAPPFITYRSFGNHLQNGTKGQWFTLN